ncbi:MFS transporter OS=Streptomyces antimycoticus OX=68175 GN=SSPO_010220 PE=4 SV=1 [Streptomyces antimycoticus]
MLIAVLIGSATQLVLIPLAAALSDRVNRRRMYAVAAALAAIWPFVFLPAVLNGSFVVLVGGIVVGLGLHSIHVRTAGRLHHRAVLTPFRASGSSLAFAIGSTFGGAMAPLAFTALLSWQGNVAAPRRIQRSRLRGHDRRDSG